MDRAGRMCPVRPDVLYLQACSSAEMENSNRGAEGDGARNCYRPWQVWNYRQRMGKGPAMAGGILIETH